MRVSLFITAILLSVGLRAQQGSSAMSLEACIEYALANNAEMKNAALDEKSAVMQVKETRGIGLPQISGSAVVQKSPTLQRFYAQYTPGSPIGLTDEQATELGVVEGDVYAAENFFQLQSVGDASLGVNQIIFSGSYIVALQASNTFKELSVRQKDETRVNIIENVSKAYYDVLINQERLNLFTANLTRLDTLYRNTRELYNNGFAEEIDVDRLKVSLNNLKSDRDNIINLNTISMTLLKFQMGYPLEQSLELSGTFDDVLGATIARNDAQVKYEDRPGYQTLLVNRKLQELNIRNKYAEALPTLSGFANLGVSTQSQSFGGLFSTQSNFDGIDQVGPDSWYRYSSIGLSLNWNIFTGLQRRFQIQREKVSLEQLDNGINQYQSLIDLEVQTSRLALQNAVQKIEVQRENMELADKVFRVTQIKYQEGIGSNLEVVEADTALKEAQTNYYNALYDAIIARIDLQKALGTLN
ncbi:MAG: TolC family protein [Cytophagales bacterium]|nr:TolC family protein [Cytophagales bacterium]